MEQRKRSVVLIYGEHTEGLSIKVPVSKKEEIRDRFYALLKEYENPSVIMVDCFGLGDSGKSKPAVENFKVTPSDVDNIVENPNAGVRNKKDVYVIPVSNKQVASLPKDRKLITEGGYKGLYSGDGKWYTNKVIDNQLLILEWEDLESAKTYLDSLIK